MRMTLWSLMLSCGLCAAASGQVVISQVDGNGGLTVAGVDPYDRDFVELLNIGTTPVNLNGWSVQLFGDSGSSTTAFTPSWDVIPLSGTIYPGQYFLIAPSFQRGSLGSAVTTSPLPAPDVMGPVYNGAVLVSGANAVALMSTTTQIPAGQCPSGPNLVDLFRYGHPIALCYEGSPPTGPCTSAGAARRNNLGCMDTNNSAADISVNQAPNPHNSDTNIFVDTIASPSVITNGVGGVVTLTAALGPAPCNPLPGALTAAAANLTAFGLGANMTMFDDGAHGDGGAGDGVFGIQVTVSPSQAAGDYVIPITATSSATTLGVTVRVRVFPPPATNDACVNAINLTNPSGINIVTNGPYHTIVNNSTATGDGIDAGTCNGDTEVKFSVWYQITAPAAGALRISENSSEDIVCSLHASCGASSSICMNREDGGFPLASGVTYLVQIGRETGSGVTPQVPLDLTFTWVPALANDTACGAETITSFPFSATPFAPAATDEPATINISCDATANTGARNGVWYTFVAPVNGALEFFERSINPTNFTLLTGPCASPTLGTCVDETTSGALITGLAGGTQYLLLVSYDSAATTSTTSQAYDFTVNFLPTPANDLCSGAVNLNTTGLPYAETVQARAATGDAGVPTSTGGSGVNTCGTTLGTRPNGVWYSYTTGPSVTGTLRVADFSANDVFYNVFTSCGGSAVQCYGAFTNDDIFIQLAPNTTYFILVGMQSTTGSASGDYSLTFALYPAPANDLPCGATFVNSSTFNDIVAGPSATPDVDVSCNYNIPVQTTTGYGVWYRFMPSSPKQLTVHQNASDVLVYGLFSGPDCNNLTEIDCKMGSNGALTTDNTAYFNLNAGVQVWLLIGKIANSQPFGFYDLSFTLSDAKGACCTGTTCTITTQAGCAGTWKGPFTYCGETPQYEESPFAAIPDYVSPNPGVLTRTITVNDNGVVNDLKVLIDINHARVGDLIVTVTAPGGASSALMQRIDDDDDTNCPANGSQGRLTDLGATYIFDDQSYNPYGPGMHAAAKYFDFTGLVVPAGHYKASRCNQLVADFGPDFNGAGINGTWTLTISDHQASSTGTLNRWGLIINYGAEPFCGCNGDINSTGVTDGDDIGPFVDCLLVGGGSNCSCADVSNYGGVGPEDLPLFVNRLLSQ